jgi:hypothetical protein
MVFSQLGCRNTSVIASLPSMCGCEQTDEQLLAHCAQSAASAPSYGSRTATAAPQ